MGLSSKYFRMKAEKGHGNRQFYYLEVEVLYGAKGQYTI